MVLSKGVNCYRRLAIMFYELLGANNIKSRQIRLDKPKFRTLRLRKVLRIKKSFMWIKILLSLNNLNRHQTFLNPQHFP